MPHGKVVPICSPIAAQSSPSQEISTAILIVASLSLAKEPERVLSMVIENVSSSVVSESASQLKS